LELLLAFKGNAECGAGIGVPNLDDSVRRSRENARARRIECDARSPAAETKRFADPLAGGDIEETGGSIERARDDARTLRGELDALPAGFPAALGRAGGL